MFSTNPKRIFDLLESPITGRWLIEASAGTGKTYSLEHIVLRLLIEQNIPVERMLLVTFTHAATAELSQRVRNLIMHTAETLERGQAPDDALLAKLVERWETSIGQDVMTERLRNALEMFDDVSILTIHSFCQKMLKSFVFTRGANFEAEVCNDTAIEEQVIDEFLRSHLSTLPPDRATDLLAWKKTFSVGLNRMLECGDTAYSNVRIYEEPEAPEDAGRDCVNAVVQEFFATAPARVRKLRTEAGIMTFSDMLVDMHRLVKTNPELAALVRAQFDAVLIDEFQDTDTMQYDIFKTLFLPPSGGPRSVFFVGDPKQAIYSFRNAELATYMKARAEFANAAESGPETTGILELRRNFRTTPALVELVNAFFSRSLPEDASHFVTEKIDFTPACTHKANLPLLERKNGLLHPIAPFSVWLIPPEAADTDGHTVGQDCFEKITDVQMAEARWIAADVARLLNNEIFLTHKSDGIRRLRAGDIAVLVDKRASAVFVINALRNVGVRAVLNTKDDVFKTVEADEILCVLKAIETPSLTRVVNAARSTRIFGRTLSELHGDADAAANDRALLQNARRQFINGGVTAALHAVFNGRRTPVQLLPIVGGAETLAIYEHIIELLAANQSKQQSLETMIRYFERERNRSGTTPQAREKRTVSDENVVRIETIHASKGLEYPVVYLWQSAYLNRADGAKSNCFVADRNEAVKQIIVSARDVSASKQPAGDAADFEESVRLAYVAMTRASCRLVMPLFLTLNTRSKPRAYVNAYTAALYADRSVKALAKFKAPADRSRALEEQLHRLFKKAVGTTPQSLEAFRQTVQIPLDNINPTEYGAHRLCDKFSDPGHLYELVHTPPETPLPVTGATQDSPQPEALPDTGACADWSRSSFTAISRRLMDEHALNNIPEEFEGEIPTNEMLPEQTLTSLACLRIPEDTDKDSTQPPAFPKGPDAGDWLHKMMQRLIEAPVERRDEILEQIPQRLGTAGFMQGTDESALELAAKNARNMLENALNTPLFVSDRGPLIIGNLPVHARAAEMPFVMPCSNPHLTVGDLTKKLAQAGITLTAAAPEHRLKGYLSGSIDLLCGSNGLWWVIDWKSNAAGQCTSADYNAAGMQMIIDSHHYALQYIIYLTALKRHLKAVLGLSDEQTWEKIGGALYVFLRGIDPQSPPFTNGCRNGVFFARPRKAVDILDKLLKG